MWMGAGGVDGELMVAGCVYACLGGGIVDSFLSQHPNIMLVKKKNNTRDSGCNPKQFVASTQQMTHKIFNLRASLLLKVQH